ncbi:hypothetical protein [Bdellovibrio sp. KM01]|uniref:hypothetical protein n=1 Tax=Bdellovibrio sp. KM01 TaxID=2748865 RepID=UPI0015EA3D2C|nr:hypothetical protein [Bdellovibrio sp. KM01]QLY26647.1 hypothetical protein HW988_06420 [Bdellovibrio sp. KM01]
MSNDIIETARTTRANTTEKEATTASTAKETGKKSLFGNLNADLKQALDTWDVITETMTNKVSPEQEQLQEVKKLLGDLKAKLAQFED